MTLAEWMSSPPGSEWTCDSLATAIGATSCSVVSWRTGRYIPSRAFLVAIAELTNGAVMANDYYPELKQVEAGEPVTPPSVPGRRQRRVKRLRAIAQEAA